MKTMNEEMKENELELAHSDEEQEKQPIRYAVAITTVDNPYDPLDDFYHWYLYDMEAGYNSCAYLDRVSFTSNALSEVENANEIERAIDEIIKYDFTNMYRKIKRVIPS